MINPLIFINYYIFFLIKEHFIQCINAFQKKIHCPTVLLNKKTIDPDKNKQFVSGLYQILTEMLLG